MPSTYEDRERFSAWLRDRVITVARGDNINTLEVDPEGVFWLGRLAPESRVSASNFGDRAERLDPCAIGFRIRQGDQVRRQIRCIVRACCWHQPQKSGDGEPQERWIKTERVEIEVMIEVPHQVGDSGCSGRSAISQAFADAGVPGIEAEVRVEVESGKQGPELVVTLVNVTDNDLSGISPSLFEVQLEAKTGLPPDFELEALPLSFRFDRRMPAYGINSGVYMDTPGTFVTTDYVESIVRRPVYWDEGNCGPQPDLSYKTLSNDPIPHIRDFVNCLRSWGRTFWEEYTLRERAASEAWSDEMLDEALRESAKFTEEVERIESGLRLLEQDNLLLRAFRLMNAAFDEGTTHNIWRAFQLGFVLASLPSIHSSTRDGEADIVDTLWFSTGGGKTETYLGLLVTAALYDRISGKKEGITGWARFPLRMLSLQQTQRFAEAFAAAELVRQRENIQGECFSIGFFVGQSGTPNRVRENSSYSADPNDREMPARYRVLLECPFCHSPELRMEFDRVAWTLNHICQNGACPWGSRPLPFRIVDEEIYRLLPTVVVGTLDKAASISMQAAMRAFYSAPYGRCSVPGHGFTYSPRSDAPKGCRYPSCTAPSEPLSQAPELYPPRIRIQDELHLLRDTLGAVSTHYEALLDQLLRNSDSKAKIFASSATLEGYDHQTEALYRRDGRLFPLPGPRSGHSFWETDTELIGRRYLALAPRGVTMEFATDRTNEALQRAIRESHDDPQAVAGEAGVPISSLSELVSIYGTQVTYGTSLKDVEAAARSFQTEVQVEPVNSNTLTGGTPLEDVRTILDRLNNPETEFCDRIHLIAASSMLSHGVDVDRLNVMIMLGIPLSMAEFIQASSRVGRTHPGIVFVMHKIGRERDAAVYRSFKPFIDYSDRLVDPIPITRRSRRVLELTYSGLFLGRMLGLHEAEAVARGLRPPTKFNTMRQVFQRLGIREEDELRALIEMLDVEGPLDEGMRRDLEEWTREVFRALNDPATSAEWPSDLMPKGPPMLSLRDVEEQAPVFSRGGGR